MVHRYPPNLLISSNFAFTKFIESLVDKAQVIFVSFLDNDVRCSLPDSVIYKPIPMTFHREKFIDRTFKNMLFLLYVPFYIWKLNITHKFTLIYCDDSLPLYGLFIKLVVDAKVMTRLGDLQIGYILGTAFKKFIFKFLFHLEKMAWRKVDGLITISDAYSKFLLSWRISQEKIFLVEECIDAKFLNEVKLDSTIRQKYGVDDNEILIMFHGILSPHKGVDTLLYAFHLLKRQVTNVRLLVVGDGPSLTHLITTAEQLSLNGSVIFTGWVSYEDIPLYINSCDIGVVMRTGDLANNFVVTSALLQYWAFSKPVIAPKLMAIRDVLTPGEHGLLFTPDDEDDLMNNLVYMIHNIDEGKRMGKNGRDVAQQRYHNHIVGNELANILITKLYE